MPKKGFVDRMRAACQAVVNIIALRDELAEFNDFLDNSGFRPFGRHIVSDATKALRKAIMHENEHEVRLALAAGADANFFDRSNSALGMAISRRNKIILEELLKHGSNPNLPANHYEEFPLHVACSFIKGLLDGDLEGVKLLLQYGANVNALDSLGRTPLIRMAYFYHPSNQVNVKIEEMLVDNGADIFRSTDLQRSYHEMIAERLNTKESFSGIILESNFFKLIKINPLQPSSLNLLILARKRFLDISFSQEEQSLVKFNPKLSKSYFDNMKPLYDLEILQHTKIPLPEEIIRHISTYIPTDEIIKIAKDKAKKIKLIKDLNHEGYRTQDVPGDGNCFFHAVEAQLAHHQLGHKNLRTIAAEYIRGNLEYFTPFIIGTSPEAYINRIAQNGVWVDNVIIQALADALRVNIDIRGLYNTHITIAEDSPTIRLLYTGDHYLAILRNPVEANIVNQTDHNHVELEVADLSDLSSAPILGLDSAMSAI